MKKLLFVLLMLFAVNASFGQIKYGIKAGINLSNISQNFKDSNDEFNTKLKPGFQLGLAAIYNLNESFDIITGLSYSQKGFSSDLEDGLPPGVSIEGYSRLTIGYIELPINIAYKINDFRFMAGPYVAFGVNGKSKWDLKYSENGQVLFEEADSDSNYKFKNKLGAEELADNNAYIKAIDYGLGLGIGYDINGLLINVNYQLGLSNLNPKIDVSGATDDSKDFKMTNRVLTVSVSYFFTK